MKNNVDVVDIVNAIKQEIREENISIGSQYLATKYYKKRISVYREQKEIVIFGAGNYGVTLYRMLGKEEISQKVKCFCDNNKLLQNTECEGMPVFSAEEAYRKFPNAMFVITPRSYENEILKQLLQMGISIEKISIFIMALTGLEN